MLAKPWPVKAWGEEGREGKAQTEAVDRFFEGLSLE